jgi:hypothetical protein
LPADFLIGPDGAILDVKYGAYVDDHWSVDDLSSLNREHPDISRAPAVNTPGMALCWILLPPRGRIVG